MLSAIDIWRAFMPVAKSLSISRSVSIGSFLPRKRVPLVVENWCPQTAHVLATRVRNAYERLLPQAGHSGSPAAFVSREPLKAVCKHFEKSVCIPSLELTVVA